MRVLVNEPLDPHGSLYRWISADLAALGHEVLACPVQELVPRLGVRAYQATLVDLVTTYRVDLVLVHPPYDFLGLDAARAVQAAGARLVAFGFDDTIMSPLLREERRAAALVASFDARFSLYTSTSATWVAWLRAHGLRRAARLRWAMSRPAPRLGGPQVRPSPRARVLLMGRPYPRRVRLLRALAAEGARVDVYGHGWEEVAPELPPEVTLRGVLQGPARAATFRAAPAVLCPAGWEDRPDVRMVKARLLEVTTAGGLALAERCPDLDDYFGSDEVLGYDTPAQAARWCERLSAGEVDGLAVARRGERRALGEHSWEQRLPELSALLDEHQVGLRTRQGGPGLHELRPPSSYRVAMMALAHDLERAGAWSAAATVLAALLVLSPDDSAALAALGRCQYAQGDPASAVATLSRAAQAITGSVGADAAQLPLSWPAASGRTGLGVAGLLGPGFELAAYRLAALVDAGAHQEALDLLASDPHLVDGDGLAAAAALLDPAAGGESARAVWAELGRRLADAEPRLLTKAARSAAARFIERPGQPAPR